MTDQPDYKTLFPTDPAQMHITADTPDLGGLRETLRQWLKTAENEGKIDDLTTIARAFAMPGDPYPYTLRDPYNCYRVREYTLHYQEREYLQVGHRIIYGDFFVLIVTRGGQKNFELIGGFRVVHYIGHTYLDEKFKDAFQHFIKTPPDHSPHMPGRNLYLPGEWEQAFIPNVKMAQAALKTRQDEEERQKRNALLRDIGITPKGENNG